MLTPAFEISQDEHFLTIIIKCPMSKVKDTEIFMEEDEFKFYSKPYYLRLTLPGKIIENGKESAKYEADIASYTVKVPKLNPGEYFEGLDMITKLLAPKGKSTAAAPLIEVLESSSNAEFDDIDEEDIDWQIEQIPYEVMEEVLTTEGYYYGFAHQRSGVFTRLKEEFHEVLDIRDPDVTSYTTRCELRFEDEQQKFDPEHYLADLYETDCIDELLKYRAPWQLLKASKSCEVSLTAEEKDIMRKLPAKEYLLDKRDVMSVWLGLIDIIYAYAYNYRTTEGENNVESAWTLRKLSATLSWFERFTNMKHVVISSTRRSLCFPLHRNWKLSRKILKDTKIIFSLGRKYLLKCLLDIHQILCHSESYYILNDLYITDYCVWIQSASVKKLDSLTRSLMKVKMDKDEVGLNLMELENEADSALQSSTTDSVQTQLGQLSISEQNLRDDNPGICVAVANLNVNDGDESSDTDSTSTSDDSDSDDDSSSCNSDVDSNIPIREPETVSTADKALPRGNIEKKLVEVIQEIVSTNNDGEHRDELIDDSINSVDKRSDDKDNVVCPRLLDSSDGQIQRTNCDDYFVELPAHGDDFKQIDSASDCKKLIEVIDEESNDS
ncbi:protein SHQ1 homolog [Tubulanus polymorphus]|uniref:protein SHQ1 homolog n=1 Tax=Tubulanus polymorphus TaxID=672921 RepID=UPI003DA5C484